MPRKGYRSLTLPENIWCDLKSQAELYGTTAPRLIKVMMGTATFDETFIKKFHGGVCTTQSHGNSDGKLINCTVQIEGLEKFYEWMRSRRQISEYTSKRYLRIVSGFEPEAKPEQFLTYGDWKFEAFRLYVHYRYQMGLLSAEERSRWLELLKLRKRECTEPPEVKEDDVRALMNGTHDPLVDILYYSGVRIAEAFCLAERRVQIPVEDFGSFRRYEVKWTRGKKRCEYAYLPSFVKLTPVGLDRLHPSRGLPMSLKMLRKFFYRAAKRTALENRADPLIADFYQSRVSKFTTGERHYGELRNEADRLYPKVVEVLSSTCGRG